MENDELSLMDPGEISSSYAILGDAEKNATARTWTITTGAHTERPFGGGKREIRNVIEVTSGIMLRRKAYFYAFLS